MVMILFEVIVNPVYLQGITQQISATLQMPRYLF